MLAREKAFRMKADKCALHPQRYFQQFPGAGGGFAGVFPKPNLEQERNANVTLESDSIQDWLPHRMWMLSLL